MKMQLKEVSHTYLRYANCWEDADVLTKSLVIDKNSRILSIGSAGDNSFSCLAFSPEKVVAVDINPIQLHLIELKKAAISVLSRCEYLEFAGFTASKQRAYLFARVKNKLIASGKSQIAIFWETKEDVVLNGIIYAGKFERYFTLFRTKILPLIHTKRRIEALFEIKTGDEQAIFYNQIWNNKRWQALFKIFFGEFVMGRLGRSKAFMNEVEMPVGNFIFQKAETHLKSINCQQNYFLHFILQGKFTSMLPHYVRAENYHRIQKNIDKLEVFEGFAENAFQKYGKFNRFNLSDIFEYMTPEIFKSVSKNLLKNAESGALFAYWNLMVNRRISVIYKNNFEYLKDISIKMTKDDKGFFYNKFILDRKK